MRLKRTVVGCGVQGGACLALAVSGREGKWCVRWGLYGEMGESEFAKELSGRVWRRPLWAPPTEGDAEQGMTVCGIDLSFLQEGNPQARLRKADVRAALRTQVMGRLTQASRPAVLHGLELVGPSGELHLIGAASHQDTIDQHYRVWKKTMNVINPHIGANALALANLYLALYPERRRRASPCRMIVLEGRETTHAILMDDWRLLDAIHYQMMEGQCLDTDLLAQWVQFFTKRFQLDPRPSPCIIDVAQPNHDIEGVEFWSPFTEQPPTVHDEAIPALIQAHPDLAPLAFGMALQGG